MSIKESALTAIQAIADTDFFRAVTSVGASRKVLASDVGKYVLEDYESELAGSEQSVTDAIDAMNEKNADALDRIKKSLIVDSASGSIASFNDGNDVFPFPSCVVNISPLQDLHGYDAPWVGGAGKNILPPRASATNNGITLTWGDDGSVTFEGTATANAVFTIPFTLPANTTVTFSANNETAISSGARFMLIGGDEKQVYLSLENTQATWTPTADVTSARFSVLSGYTVSGKCYPQVELGSSATSFAPYSNICPITGWTGCEVDVAGVNIFDEQTLVSLCSAVKQSDGTYYISNLNSAYNKKIWNNPTGYEGQLTITFIRKQASSGTGLRWKVYYTDGTNESIGNVDQNADIFTTYTLVTNASKVVDYIVGDYGGNKAAYCNIQIEVGSTASDYKPYSATVYPITWQTEAGTVYGGTVDVVSGVLKVDRATVTLNGQTSEIGFSEVSQATTADGTKYIAYIPMNSFGMKQNNIALSDSYAFKDLALNSIHVGEFNARNSYMRFVIADQTLDTLSKWNEYLANNPMQLVYELAEPITYQLDPVQVACLLGQNNVWADCGDIEEVKFYADPTIYISNLLGTKEDNFTADSAISEGDVFSIGDNIYKATATIAVGETIAVGTNCVQTSITEQINALYALL